MMGLNYLEGNHLSNERHKNYSKLEIYFFKNIYVKAYFRIIIFERCQKLFIFSMYVHNKLKNVIFRDPLHIRTGRFFYFFIGRDV